MKPHLHPYNSLYHFPLSYDRFPLKKEVALDTAAPAPALPNAERDEKEDKTFEAALPTTAAAPLLACPNALLLVAADVDEEAKESVSNNPKPKTPPLVLLPPCACVLYVCAHDIER